MKTKRPTTFNAFLDQKYGEKGSTSRDEFDSQAQAYMVAELLKESRKQANMTQEQLAQKLSVNRAYISKLERAKSDIQLSTLRKIIEQGLGAKLRIQVEFK